MCARGTAEEARFATLLHTRLQRTLTTAAASLPVALDTDLDWVREHTRLLVRAAGWQERRHDTSLLLHGADLLAAEQWLTNESNASLAIGRELDALIASVRAGDALMKEPSLRAPSVASCRAILALRRTVLDP